MSDIQPDEHAEGAAQPVSADAAQPDGFYPLDAANHMVDKSGTYKLVLSDFGNVNLYKNGNLFGTLHVDPA